MAGFIGIGGRIESEQVAGSRRNPHDGLRPAGWGLLAVSAGLWLAAYSQLGPQRTANGYFFGRGPTAPVSGGIYRWLRNPMYDAYALAFAGGGLARANAVYLLLAAESVLLLNLLEAKVENRPFSRPRTSWL